MIEADIVSYRKHKSNIKIVKSKNIVHDTPKENRTTKKSSKTLMISERGESPTVNMTNNYFAENDNESQSHGDDKIIVSTAKYTKVYKREKTKKLTQIL